MIPQKDLIRDSSNAVINVDKTGLEEYRLKKNKIREQRDTIKKLNNLEERVVQLEKLVGELIALSKS